MKIDINTKFITLIGDPLKQSFAARMQNVGYEAADLNMVYFYTEADSEHLGEIMKGIRCMPSFAGCAVTKPNKVEVLRYLDELDPLCEKMGACNTVLRTEDNRLIGYNTDGMGFALSMKNETDLDLRGIQAFCIGAGGAGRAICSSLANEGAERILIADKFKESADSLAEDLQRNFGVEAEAVPFGNLKELPSCGLVINASGIGMGKTLGQTPIDMSTLKPGQFCFDACYNPAKTAFLEEAEKRGCRVLNGLGMSLYQGAAQIKIWTGKEAPLKAMWQELLKIIEEGESR